MKKLVAMLLALVFVLSMAVACANTEPETTEPETTEPETTEPETTEPETTEPETTEPETTEPEAEGYEIALITDIGTIDDKSFNQGAWEGVVAYAEANGKTHKYYQPTEQSNDAYLAQIELAVNNGAKIIVTPGFLFEEPIFIAQDLYPEVCFILLDGSPHNTDYSEYRTGDNVVGVTYAEQQAGYLAGYAAVKDGNTKLGFMGGMAVPAVVRFGYGYIQGADAAAAELGANVEIMYHYTGAFAASPEAQALAASWYTNGTQVIFGCGGAVGFSVFAAAEAAGTKSIGVDVDQSGESETIITSAMKSLAPGVEKLIGQYYDGTFPGGQNLVLDASNDSIGLPMETSKFSTFTMDEYTALFTKLAGNEIEIVKDESSGGPALPTELTVTNTTVTFVE